MNQGPWKVIERAFNPVTAQALLKNVELIDEALRVTSAVPKRSKDV
jgi:hypothetical protein